MTTLTNGSGNGKSDKFEKSGNSSDTVEQVKRSLVVSNSSQYRVLKPPINCRDADTENMSIDLMLTNVSPQNRSQQKRIQANQNCTSNSNTCGSTKFSQTTESGLEEGRIREKLRGCSGKKEADRRSGQRGPMMARQPFSPSSSSSSPTSGATTPSSNCSSLARRRTPSPGQSQPHSPSAPTSYNVASSPTVTPFQRQVVQCGRYSRSQSSQQLAVPQPQRRTPSPASSEVSEAWLKRLERARTARLYLLQQSGPNSFLLGCGDKGEAKCRVIVGPQTCSGCRAVAAVAGGCGAPAPTTSGGWPCLHILFVMKRVFQLSDNDPLLWTRPLKNFEVESLFRRYEARKTARFQSRKKYDADADSSGTVLLNNANSHSVGDVSKFGAISQCAVGVNQAVNIQDCAHLLDSKCSSLRPSDGCHVTIGTTTDAVAISRIKSNSQSVCSPHEEEDTCSICLLEMLDSELLVQCSFGCHNNFHEHCISIWFEECRLQADALICPLCRSDWGRPRTTHIEAASSAAQSAQVPEELLIATRVWTQVFGAQIVAQLFSRAWDQREAALRQLAALSAQRLAQAAGDTAQCDLELDELQELICGLQVVVHCCQDTVYKVFVGALRALRELLAWVPCWTRSQQLTLQRLMTPVTEAVLAKCADSNRRPAQLAVSTLVELGRGQDGELAIGRELAERSREGLGGLRYLLSCIHQSASDPQSIIACLGRLYTLEKLLEAFPKHFIVSETDVTNKERLMLVLRYSLTGLSAEHAKLGKLSRRVFILAARLAAHEPSAFNDVEALLHGPEIEHSTSSVMLRRLNVLKEEFAMAREVARLCPSTATGNAAQQGLDVAAVTSDNLYDRPRSSQASTTVASPRSGFAATPTSSGGNEVTYVNTVVMAQRLRQGGFRPIGGSAGSSVDSDEEQPPPPPPRTASRQGSCAPVTPTPRLATALQQSSAVSSLSLEPTSHAIAASASATFVHSTSHATLSSCASPPRISELAPESYYSEPREPPPPAAPVRQSSLQSEPEELQLLDCNGPPHHSSLAAVIASPDGSPDLLGCSRGSGGGPTFRSEVMLAARGAAAAICKERIEAEEALALSAALQASEYQHQLPIIPGLSGQIRVQNNYNDCGSASTPISDRPPAGSVGRVYEEGQHWTRGPQIGSGGCSICYQARDNATGALMAVKVVQLARGSEREQQELAEAIREEVQLMTRLDHPNVLRILGATPGPNANCNLFIEWMPGGSVSSLLARYGRFTETVIINYTQQILRGLAYLHDNGILHRDLKGANLLCASSGQQVRIADFGAAAKLASQSTGHGEFLGQFIGTIPFMAPEVLRGEHYGRSSDIWSVGCVVIEMVTTKPPWNASQLSNHLRLVWSIGTATGPPPLPEGISPALRDFLLRCLEVDPMERPAAKDLLTHPLFTRYKR